MKLELKHLAPYLPYGLKISNRLYSSQSYFIMEGDNIDGVIRNNIEGLKPILRPLSDLTTNIVVNGEMFIPSDRIINKFDGSFDPFTASNYRYFDGRDLTLHTWLALFEWHFDVFGLIEKGLAIDINTLDK